MMKLLVAKCVEIARKARCTGAITGYLNSRLLCESKLVENLEIERVYISEEFLT
jgi:hypothetical protein